MINEAAGVVKIGRRQHRRRVDSAIDCDAVGHLQLFDRAAVAGADRAGDGPLDHELVDIGLDEQPRRPCSIWPSAADANRAGASAPPRCAWIERGIADLRDQTNLARQHEIGADQMDALQYKRGLRIVSGDRPLRTRAADGAGSPALEVLRRDHQLVDAAQRSEQSRRWSAVRR